LTSDQPTIFLKNFFDVAVKNQKIRVATLSCLPFLDDQLYIVLKYPDPFYLVLTCLTNPSPNP